MRDEAEAQATKTRSPNYNEPSCGKDWSESDELEARRMSDRIKPARADEYKKAM